jgi:2-C-methyl-D-erythritol 4-phosphate cytidylyltransferase
MNRVVAIVPAAGTGKRFGPGTNKPLHTLLGKPLIIWVLEVLQGVDEISEILPVVKEQDLEAMAELIGKDGIDKVKRIVPGGRERQDSVYKGLKTLDDAVSVVLIHDGVRPLVERELIRRSIAELKGCDGVITGVPVKDTIKKVCSRRSAVSGQGADARVTSPPSAVTIQDPDMMVQETLDRSVLRAIQTPQVFMYQRIRDAYDRAYEENYYATDDAALIERYGGTVKVVMGSYRNIKITTPEDMLIAEALYRACA